MARWGLPPAELESAVDASVGNAFPDGAPSARERDRYVESLHLEDLALARACALGHDAAWDQFVLEQRPVLYRAADALDPSGGSRELADSLYADLYGMREADGERRSLFRYFHGRSSLATWLRAVLSQRYVDALRARARVEPIDESEVEAVRETPRPRDPDREILAPLFERALQVAVEALAPRDRLCLRSYYVAQLTLAEIGRITGEHEATISRRLSRTRRDLRAAVERSLREESRLTGQQIARAFELALEDPGELNLQKVFDAASERKESLRDRST